MNTTFPLQVETEAFRWALSLASNMAFEVTFIETDSKIWHDALAVPDSCPWRIKSISIDMLNILSNYANLSVSWIPRAANEAAHSLTK